MDSSIMNLFKNPGTSEVPGTEQNNNLASVTFSDSYITMESSGNNDKYYYATFSTKEKVKTNIFQNGIEISYKLNSGSAPPRFMVILSNKRFDITKGNYYDSCFSSSEYKLPILKSIADYCVQNDSEFGYRAFGFKHNNLLFGGASGSNVSTLAADDDSQIVLSKNGGAGINIGKISFCFVFPCLLVNNEIINNEIFTPKINTIIFDYWQGGQPVDLYDCYMSIIMCGSEKIVKSSVDILNISDFKYEPALKSGYQPHPKGETYLVSRKALTMLANSVRKKAHREDSHKYSIENMIEDIYRINPRRMATAIRPDGVFPLDVEQTKLKKLSLYNGAENDFNFHRTGGWSFNDDGYGRNLYGKIQVTDGKIILGPTHADNSSSKVYTRFPVNLRPRKKFNIRELINSGYEGLQIKFKPHSSTSSQGYGADRFFIFFAPQVLTPTTESDTSMSKDLDVCFPAGYKQFYVAFKCDLTGEITDTYPSSAYINYKEPGQNDNGYGTISLIFNKSILEKVPNDECYIVFAMSRNEWQDSVYNYSANNYSLKGVYDNQISSIDLVGVNYYDE